MERTHEHESHFWAYYTFKLETSERSTMCSECNSKVKAGEKSYVHRNKKGRVMKRICSERCGKDFDYRELDYAAELRERGMSRFD